MNILKSKKEKWTKVSDRIPNYYTDVLVCDIDGVVSSAYPYEDGGIFIGFKEDSRDEYCLQDVTHWRLLPAPPTK